MNGMVFNGGGLALILLIIYWFWLYRPSKSEVSDNKAVDIVVENGVFTPSVIETPVNQSILLNFERRDESPCAQMMIFPDFERSLELEVGRPASITLHPQDIGEFHFSCQMGMYRGTLIVKS